MATVAKPHFLIRRWRVLLGLVAGAAALAFAHLRALPPGLSSLIAWNAACLVFLATTLWMLWRDDEVTVRQRAAYEDQGQSITLAIVLSAVIASLAATVIALREQKAGAHASNAPPWAWVFSISTLILGWIVVQTVFTLRYAHRYFGDGNADGKADGGVKFPGDPPKTYQDFIYMAVCIGASAQVSDFNLTDTRFRQLVTQHSLLAFFFNTMVLALGINILATIIAQ